jgi:hypothetical protein
VAIEHVGLVIFVSVSVHQKNKKCQLVSAF